MLLVFTPFIINTSILSLSLFIVFHVITCRDFSLKSSKAMRYFLTIYKVFEHWSQFPLMALEVKQQNLQSHEWKLLIDIIANNNFF